MCHSEDLKRLKKLGVKMWAGLIWLKVGTGGGVCFERGNTTADSTKREEFDQLNDY
jgi:hypothetical protein